MASQAIGNTAVHVPYPETADLKSTKGKFHSQRKKLPLYQSRGHSRVAFHGTVKVHGTNITVLIRPYQAIQIQSRNTIIAPGPSDDGYGSAGWITAQLGTIGEGLKKIIRGEIKEIMVAGELAGEGINPGQAATSNLERFYMIFGIRLDGVWLDREVWEHLRFPPGSRVYNVHEFQTYHVVIDFNEERTEGGGKIVDDFCLDVERQCPVALKLGGIQGGLGEGIVWTEERDPNGQPVEQLRFKHKGQRFTLSNGGIPSQTLNAAGNQATQFVTYAVTPARIDQGLEYIREMVSRGRPIPATLAEILRDKSHINRLSEWVKGDLRKEESAEMTRLGLNSGPGKMMLEQAVTKAVKEYFNSHR